jgi:ribose 5-phosphate isomerase
MDLIEFYLVIQHKIQHVYFAFRPSKKEIELKSIPGVLKVGLFTRRADVYYKAMHNGSFDIIKF